VQPTAYEVTVNVRFPSDGRAVMEDVRARAKGVPHEQANSEKTEFQARIRVAATDDDAGSAVRSLIEECAETRGLNAQIRIGEVRAVEWAG
jgi:hypothetical protein